MRTKFDHIKPINEFAIVCKPKVAYQVDMPGSSLFVSQFFGRVGISTIEEARTKRNRINGGENPVLFWCYSNRKDVGPSGPLPDERTDGGIILFHYDGTQTEIPRHTFNELKPYHES